MAEVTGFTAARMQVIEDEAIASGHVDGSGHLILTRNDATAVDAGSVIGPTGPTGTPVPPGVIAPYAAAAAPSGWQLCDGSAISRTTFAALFAIIGTTYGAGNGTTTFNVPNLKGRVPVGFDSTQTEFDALGETGGEKTHVLTTPELASHAHSVDPPSTNTGVQSVGHTHGTSSGGSFITNTGGGGVIAGGIGGSAEGQTGAQSASHTHAVDIAAFNSATAGSGTAHNNLQPYMALPYIIKT